VLFNEKCKKYFLMLEIALKCDKLGQKKKKELQWQL